MAIKTAQKHNAHPVVIGEYRNGAQHEVCVKNEPAAAVMKAIYKLRGRNGGRVVKYRRLVSHARARGRVIVW